MQEEIIFREYKKEDDNYLAEIIRQTWNYDRFCSSKVAEKLGKVYLYTCLAEQTYTKVATIDNKPVGIIMGKNIKKHKCPLRIRIKEIILIISLYLSKEGRYSSNIFKKVDEIDKQLLKESNKNYEGELSFFVVDLNCRGLGIGKNLFNSLTEYMKKENIKEFYLYTDTTCNHKFYEHQGMIRKCQKEYDLDIKHQKEKTTFFLYEYTIIKTRS